MYDFSNLGFNYFMMLACSFGFMLLLVLIEADIFQCCAKFTFKALPSQ